MDKNIITEVSKKLNLPEDVIELAYKSLWEFIRNKIQELPLKEDLDFNDFLKLRTNFNIPSLGKLSCTYDRMLKVKKKYNYIKNAKN